MTEISFTTSKEEDKLIDIIVNRAAKLTELDRMTISMDLASCRANGCSLDFQKLLDFDNSSFLHDIYGISKHLDRNTGKIENCFMPRSAK